MPFDPHIRPVNLRKDLAAIADLVDVCFSPTMDVEGFDYLRHIRQIAGSMGMYLSETATPENSHLPFQGYVWVEGGKLIGNLTLINVRKGERGHYLIANVATDPAQRGRGIARQLTARAIAHVREHNGKKIFLQVREDNPTAHNIYKEFEFIEDTRRTTYVNAGAGRWSAPDLTPGVEVTRRRRGDWDAQMKWLAETHGSYAWNMPLQINRFEPGFWPALNIYLQGGALRSWSVRQAGELIGAATWEKGISVADYLWIGTSHEHDDVVIRALLPEVRRALFNRKFQVNYPADRGSQAFLESDMKKVHTLIWMSREISTEPELSLQLF